MVPVPLLPPDRTGDSLVVGSFYRSPGNTNVMPLLNLSKTFLSLSSEAILLAGDLNMPDVAWHELRPMENNHSELYFIFF